MNGFPTSRWAFGALLALTVIALRRRARRDSVQHRSATDHRAGDAARLNNHEAARARADGHLVPTSAADAPCSRCTCTAGVTFDRLVHDAQVGPRAPPSCRSSRSASASAGSSCSRRRAQPRSRRSALIAHELRTSADREWHRRGRAEQWLAEGMAEWVAFTSLEHLGLEHAGQPARAGHRGIRITRRSWPRGWTSETLGNPAASRCATSRKAVPTTAGVPDGANLIERDGFRACSTTSRSFERRQTGQQLP